MLRKIARQPLDEHIVGVLDEIKSYCLSEDITYEEYGKVFYPRLQLICPMYGVLLSQAVAQPMMETFIRKSLGVRDDFFDYSQAVKNHDQVLTPYFLAVHLDILYTEIFARGIPFGPILELTPRRGVRKLGVDLREYLARLKSVYKESGCSYWWLVEFDKRCLERLVEEEDFIFAVEEEKFKGLGLLSS